MICGEKDMIKVSVSSLIYKEEILENLKEADEDTKQKIIVNADEEIVCCEWCEEEFPASEMVII